MLRDLQNAIRGTRVAVLLAGPAHVPGSRRRLEDTMKFIAMAVLVCAATAATATAQDARVARGEEVYVAHKCGMCHSIADKGNKKGPLDGVGARLSSDELRQWLVDAKGMTARTAAPRKPEMKNYALAKDDVDALVAYMRTLKKK